MAQEFEKMKEKFPVNFRVDFAVSREQKNQKGEKMYIQTRMAQYAEELWELLKKDSTYVYMCGLKGMEKGIDDIMVSLAARDGKKYIFLTDPCLGWIRLNKAGSGPAWDHIERIMCVWVQAWVYLSNA